jgi:hypothetical protein
MLMKGVYCGILFDFNISALVIHTYIHTHTHTHLDLLQCVTSVLRVVVVDTKNKVERREGDVYRLIR